MKLIFILLILLIQSSFVFSEETTEHQDGPCIKIMEACKTAGFNKASDGLKKSLSKDCIQPLLLGKKIEGIILNSSDIELCKAKKAELKLKK